MAQTLPVTSQPTVPAVYSDLYTQLSGDLDDFQSAIAAVSTGLEKPITFAAQLTSANSNNGPALLNPSSMTLIQQELNFLKSMGVQAVSVEVSFPMLNSAFLGGSYSQWVTFYGNVASAVRAAGFKLIVESQTMMPSGLQSSGWGSQLQAFYPTMDFNQYVSARSSTAAVVASTMKPDYFVLQEEPDTEANQAGQPNAGTVAGSTTMLNASQAAVAGLVPGMKVGAGFGSWLAAYQAFANSFTRTGCGAAQPCLATPLDFLDMHLYPIIEQAIDCGRGTPCPPGVTNFWKNAMSVVATANAAGMHMTVSQAWLRKVRDGEWPPLGGAGDVEEAREAYDFWAPLDQRFLQALHDLATYQGMYWIAPFNTPNFSAYLQWSSANSILGDCGSGPSPCGTLTPTQVFADVQSAAIAALPQGSYTSTGQYWHDLIVSDSNMTGLWWNPDESGWGINFAHQGDIIFASWFTYDLTGKGMWVVMTAPKIGPITYSGTLYTTTGPAFNAVPFDPTKVVATAVGTGTLTFADSSDATFAYTLNGISQVKNITKYVFGPVPACTFGAANVAAATNYQDLWWTANPNESGWGVNLTQQGDKIFATWFTYDLDGSAMWLVVTAPKQSPSVYSGTLYRTTGPAFNAVPFNPADVVATPVGIATFTFSDGNDGSFAYTVNSISQVKPITRLIFRAPGTVCQ